MSAYLGYGVLLALALLWMRSVWHDHDIFGEDADDSGYSDPGKLHRQLPPATAGVAIPDDRSIRRRGVAGDLEEGGYRTTSLRLVGHRQKAQARVDGQR